MKLIKQYDEYDYKKILFEFIYHILSLLSLTNLRMDQSYRFKITKIKTIATH